MFFYTIAGMSNKPYIGITGPIVPREVDRLANIFEDNDVTMHSDHIPMIGVLVSYKTLDHGAHPKRTEYPPLDQLSNILSAAYKRAFATIHYNTRRPGKLSDEIDHILRYDGIYDRSFCQGIQINMPRPPREQVNKIKEKYNDLKIIFQLPNMVIDSMPDEKIAKLISENYSDVDYILIDPSGGEGIEFDIDRSAGIYEALKDSGINPTLGFAGGLGRDNVRDVLGELKAKLGTKNFSIDSTSKLRSDMGGDINILDLVKCEKYISEAADALKSA